MPYLWPGLATSGRIQPHPVGFSHIRFHLLASELTRDIRTGTVTQIEVMLTLELELIPLLDSFIASIPYNDTPKTLIAYE
jgi:hypothetical protein